MANRALTHQPFGYRKKPKRVFLVAIYLLIAPIAYFILNIRELGDPNWNQASTWLEYLNDLHPRVWFLLIITFSAAAMLFLVRKASWLLAIFALAMVIIYNLFVFGNFPIPAVVLLAFVLFTPFRRLYLNPRLRWWEQTPRFEVDLFLDVAEKQAKLHVYDISEGGLLAEYQGEPHPEEGDSFQVVMNEDLSLTAKVVRKQENKYLGLLFVGMKRKRKKELSVFIKNLQRRGEAKSRR